MRVKLTCLNKKFTAASDVKFSHRIILMIDDVNVDKITASKYTFFRTCC